VSLIDIVPTVLELGKIRSKGLPDGRSLVPLLQANPTGWDDRVVFAEAPPSGQNAGRRQFGARNATHKCIVYDRDPDAACYDLRTDPKELAPLDPSHDATTRALFTKLESYRTSTGTTKPEPTRVAPVTEADARREEKLRALGYVE
jgi:arylsulfatase A-like enzyme